MRAVDTNVLVRLIARDDDAQMKRAQAFVEKGAWVSTVVLAEAVWVLGAIYKRSAGEIDEILDGLLHHESVSLQDADSVAAALESFRRRPALGFADCLMLELARKAGHLPLGTFDRALAKLPDVEHI